MYRLRLEEFYIPSSPPGMEKSFSRRLHFFTCTRKRYCMVQCAIGIFNRLYSYELKAMKIECINEIADHIQLQVCNKQDNILVMHTVHVYIKFNNPDSFSQLS